jgi:hypothetical protein
VELVLKGERSCVPQESIDELASSHEVSLVVGLPLLVGARVDHYVCMPCASGWWEDGCLRVCVFGRITKKWTMMRGIATVPRHTAEQLPQGSQHARCRRVPKVMTLARNSNGCVF